MAKSYSQVNFRIPTELKERIENAATENEQSVTAELVARLEQSFTKPASANEANLYMAIDMLKKVVTEQAVDFSRLLFSLLDEGVDKETLIKLLEAQKVNKYFGEEYFSNNLDDELPSITIAEEVPHTPKTKDSGTW